MSANRRRLLAGAVAGTAAALVAPIAAGAASNPDAELLAVCALFETRERQYLSLFAGGQNEIRDDDERDEVAEPIWELQERLAERMIALHATTAAGFAAVARCLILSDETIGAPEDCATVSERLVAMLVRDAGALS